QRLLEAQGPLGEWPWFLDRKNGNAMDWYEAYSVHQHAMAYLWLLPSRQRAVTGLHTAIENSFQWIGGQNQLGQSMVTTSPFFVYRSQRRREPYSSARRLLRASMNSFLNRESRLIPSQFVEINSECRSYEMGWLLYVWTGVPQGSLDP